MKQVFKYPFDINDYIEITMPINAQILHVEVQEGRPCIWALVEDSLILVTRAFRLYGTGHPINLNVLHVATFTQPPFVWHLFEQRGPGGA